jgi:hypothetical protein
MPFIQLIQLIQQARETEGIVATHAGAAHLPTTVRQGRPEHKGASTADALELP